MKDIKDIDSTVTAQERQEALQEIKVKVDNVKVNSNKIDTNKILEKEKDTTKQEKIDNYKANSGKLDMNDFFKNWGVPENCEPIRMDNEKSDDDDMER